MLAAGWERKVGVCTCEAGAPISQADLERHPVGLRKRALPLHKSCLVFRCCGIKEKQIVISLAGPEVWRDLQLGISVPKADAVPMPLWPQQYQKCVKRELGRADHNQKQCCLGLAGTQTYIAVANIQLLQGNKCSLCNTNYYLCSTWKEAPEDIHVGSPLRQEMWIPALLSDTLSPSSAKSHMPE